MSHGSPLLYTEVPIPSTWDMALNLPYAELMRLQEELEGEDYDYDEAQIAVERLLAS